MSIGPYPINQTTKIGGATARAVFGVHNSSPLNMFPKAILIVQMDHQKFLYLVIYNFLLLVFLALFQFETLSGNNLWCWSWNWIA